MECDICGKGDTSHDDFYCTSCSRSFVYMSRLEIARILLENEQLNKRVSDVVENTPEGQSTNSTETNEQRLWQEEIIRTKQTAARGRIEEIKVQTALLKDETEKLKSEIVQRRGKLISRNDTLDTIEQTIPARRRISTNTISEMHDRGITSLGNISSKSVNTRAFLCRETATLLRLRQKKRQRNGTVVEQYLIAGLVLPDLKEINNIRCTDLTAALTSAVHLLVLVTFYLGIRLPAEITVPHRDYPLPTINTPARSYLGHKIAFPGSGSIGVTASSPFSSKHDVKIPYRPRPLFIGSDDCDEKVAQFAKRDSMAFSFFVEGIALLAWDIAWLCRSQGFSQGTNSWEDICDIGCNLHQLILGQPQSPALLRIMSNREVQKRQRPVSGTSTPSHESNAVSFAKLGQASHLSAHAFLGQAALNEQSRSWKYSNYNVIADGLKKLLITEMNNAEWELLQEQEWDDGGEQFDEAVLVRAQTIDGRNFDDARSIMTARMNAEDQAQRTGTDNDQSKPRGTSGWTKVKSRSDA